MAETRAEAYQTLLDALSELEQRVQREPAQPLHQIAENMVLHWSRVLEGKEPVQPRLTPGLDMPSAFHHGLERQQEKRIEPLPSPADQHTFGPHRRQALAHLHEAVTQYFGHNGYRSSSDQCDRMLVEASRVSRLLAMWAQEAERQRAPRRVARTDGATAPPAETEDPFLAETRHSLFLWEPFLNEVIVAWEHNGLQEFDAALTRLLELLETPEAEREAYASPAGYPLRAMGRPRHRVTVSQPTQRPLRTKSMFGVRFSQLWRKLVEGEPPGDYLCSALSEDVRHCLAMIEANHFMLANPVSFLGRARPGVPLIRGLPSLHPFLLEPMEFFKKAVLFHNGTYTAAGGGLDDMYRLVRQLQRFYHFRPGGSAKRVRPHIAACLLGWEQNQRDAFTGNLLAIAEVYRAEAEQAGEGEETDTQRASPTGSP